MLLYLLKYSLLLLVVLGGAAFLPSKESGAAEAARKIFLLGRNQVYQTCYYVFDSGVPGPKVLLGAGIHGDEVAGIFALEEIVPRIRVHSGTLIILPRMNIPAIQIQRRRYNIDLNRVFPGLPTPAPYEYPLAREIYRLVKDRQIEYVVSLHESRNMHTLRRSKTFGQTIIYGVEPPPRMIWT
jgi:hypothetical protein